MARKRGGVAGLWDRKKDWIRAIVPAALGAIPGVGVPLAVGAGAAMRGLDRPGKRGIGLDIGEGVRGGLEGYGLGRVGKGAREGITKMLAPKAAPMVPGLSNAEVASRLNPMLNPSSAASTAAAPTSVPFTPPPPTPGPLRRAGSAAKTAASKAGDFATKYEKPIELGLKGLQMGLPNPEVDVAQARVDLEQRQFDEQMRQQRLREQRQAMMAQLLIPFLQQQMGQDAPRTLDEYIAGTGALVPRSPPRLSGTAMGQYLAGQGYGVLDEDTTPAATRYASAYRQPVQPRPAMSQRYAGGYSMYDR